MTPEQAQVIKALALKMSALKLNCSFVNYEEGPIVTTYYFTLAHSVPIAKVLKSEEDLALAVGAPSVLITRKGGEIAISVPNKNKSIISFDAALHSLFTNANHKLPILLGTSTAGKFESLDLTESPHILIAGSTGSGKSVLLSSIISGLVATKSPDELKLMLVDTKQLDLTLFAGLPHVVEMCDNVEKTHALFTRLMAIVRQRTEKIKGVARNIYEYNQLSGGRPLPYYVVVIDELADVIGEDKALADAGSEPTASYERISARLQRLTQISRAAGVHVICATQRPSVKIITGDIKANFGTRIALRLPSGNDSRTIINNYGAEKLLGRGDMLVESPHFEQIQRFHGPFVSMEHIANMLINSEQIRDSYRHLKQLQLVG